MLSCERMKRHLEFSNAEGSVVYKVEVPLDFDLATATDEEMQGYLDRGRTESVPKTLTGRSGR